MARPGGRGDAERPGRQCGDFRSGRGPAAARGEGPRAQRGQDRPGAARRHPSLDASRERHAAGAIRQEDQVTVMAGYIGTPTSRLEGHLKVTGAAKYAAEVNTPGLAHGSLVTSTIAKGRIVKIDAREAMR